MVTKEFASRWAKACSLGVCSPKWRRVNPTTFRMAARIPPSCSGEDIPLGDGSGQVTLAEIVHRGEDFHAIHGAYFKAFADPLDEGDGELAAGLT